LYFLRLSTGNELLFFPEDPRVRGVAFDANRRSWRLLEAPFEASTTRDIVWDGSAVVGYGETPDIAPFLGSPPPKRFGVFRYIPR
jgi:hypothetical protein